MTRSNTNINFKFSNNAKCKLIDILFSLLKLKKELRIIILNTYM